MIYYYQRQINELAALREQFKNLLDSLTNSLIPALKKPCISLDEAVDGIISNYVIDGDRADKGSISKNKDKIEDIITKLNGSVIPAINSKISSINGSINYYEYLIRIEMESESTE